MNNSRIAAWQEASAKAIPNEKASGPAPSVAFHHSAGLGATVSLGSSFSGPNPHRDWADAGIAPSSQTFDSRRNHMRHIAALLGGAWLYFACVVMFGGFAAAWPAPAGYFAWFGREHQELALALLGVITWALPVFLLVTAGTVALFRLLAPSSPATIWIGFVGMLAAFFWYAVQSAGPGAVFSYWWALPKLLAPWLGWLAGIWLLRRRWGHARPSRSEA